MLAEYLLSDHSAPIARRVELWFLLHNSTDNALTNLRSKAQLIAMRFCFCGLAMFLVPMTNTAHGSTEERDVWSGSWF